jgi:hypothetical protein
LVKKRSRQEEEDPVATSDGQEGLEGSGPEEEANVKDEESPQVEAQKISKIKSKNKDRVMKKKKAIRKDRA